MKPALFERLPSLMKPQDELSLEERAYRMICFSLAVLSLFVILPTNWFQNLPNIVNTVVALQGLTAILLYRLSLRGRSYPTLLLLLILFHLDVMFFPNAGTHGSIVYFFVAIVAIPIVLHRGFRRWLLVSLLFTNVTALLSIEYSYPAIAVPFQGSLDRLLDLSTGFICASFGLAAILWLVLAIHARQNLLMQKLAAQLAVSERSYRDLVESANAAIFRLTVDGRVEFCNRFAERFFDTTRQDVVGLSFLGTVIPKRLTIDPSIADAMQKLIETHDAGTAIEMRGIDKNGNSVWMSWRSQPIFDDRQHVAGVLCLGADITEHKQAEEQRKHYDRQLTQMQRLESVGFLAGGIAHDFHNYLTGIVANLSLLKDALSDPAETHAIVAEVENASQQARMLTQQLLTFAKGGTPVRAAIPIDQVVRTAVSLTLRGISIRCTTDIGDDCWPVFADAGQLGQVLNNLLINAHQAMADGGTVSIHAKNITLDATNSYAINAGRYVQILVKDNGAGIPVENLGKIFDAYFTTKPVGTGLGLAIAFSVIRQHGGIISVDSEVGRGSTFSLLLPAASGPVVVTPEPLMHKGPRGARILVVDDEAMVQRTASRVLKKLDYLPTAVSDGLAAVQLYEEARASGNPFAAVIMDLTIPGGMGGKETIRRLLAIDPQVKAIVSSGYSDDPVVANYQAYGFVGVVTKPYTIVEMKQAIGKVLGGQNRPATGS